MFHPRDVCRHQHSPFCMANLCVQPTCTSTVMTTKSCCHSSQTSILFRPTSPQTSKTSTMVSSSNSASSDSSSRSPTTLTFLTTFSVVFWYSLLLTRSNTDSWQITLLNTPRVDCQVMSSRLGLVSRASTQTSNTRKDTNVFLPTGIVAPSVMSTPFHFSWRTW